MSRIPASPINKYIIPATDTLLSATIGNISTEILYLKVSDAYEPATVTDYTVALSSGEVYSHLSGPKHIVGFWSGYAPEGYADVSVVHKSYSKPFTDFPEFNSLAEAPNATAFGKGYAIIGNVLYRSNSKEWIPFTKKIDKNNSSIPIYEDVIDSITGWTLSNSNGTSIANSSVVKSRGAGSIHISSPINNPAGVATATKNNLTQAVSNDTANTYLGVVMYFPRLGAAPGFTFYAANTVDLSTGRSSSNPIAYIRQGWNVLTFDKRIAGNAPYAPNLTVLPDGVNWSSNIGSYRFRLDGSISESRDFYVDALFDNYYERPRVCITNDDGTATGYSVGYRECVRRNLPCSSFLIYDLIGNNGFVTADQAKEMASNPLSYVGLHGQYQFNNAGNGAGLDPYTEIQRNIIGLKNLGLSDCRYVAWPGGAYSPNDPTIALEPAKRLGVVGGRSTTPGYQVFYNGAYNPMVVYSIPLNNSTTLANAQAAVDNAIAWGASITFYGHNYDTVAASTTWTVADYKSLLDYIASKRSAGLIDVCRFDEMMDLAPAPKQGL